MTQVYRPAHKEQEIQKKLFVVTEFINTALTGFDTKNLLGAGCNRTRCKRDSVLMFSPSTKMTEFDSLHNKEINKVN